MEQPPDRRDLDRFLETLMSAAQAHRTTDMRHLMALVRWHLYDGFGKGVGEAVARGLEALGGPGCWALKGDAAHDLAQRARYALEAEANQS